jgi:hypothetical protein
MGCAGRQAVNCIVVFSVFPFKETAVLAGRNKQLCRLFSISVIKRLCWQAVNCIVQLSVFLFK